MNSPKTRVSFHLVFTFRGGVKNWKTEKLKSVFNQSGFFLGELCSAGLDMYGFAQFSEFS